MNTQLLVAGGGIGGLAAALAGARAGWTVDLVERAGEFTEVGAGIQIGPNVVRILNQWGLDRELGDVAAFPSDLQVCSATSGEVLGALRLGDRARSLYGAAYATIHRADMHRLLLTAVQQEPNVRLHTGRCVERFASVADGIQLHMTDGGVLQGQALVGADGIRSVVRQQLLHDGPPRIAGHLAYRTMVQQSDLPERLRSQRVTAWLGPHLHLVQYPVRQGQWLNVVGIVHGYLDAAADEWDHATNAQDLRRAMAGVCAPLRDLIEAIGQWRVWPLCDRPPMRSAAQQAQGCVALLGDAAHPMRPYLAQGAGMAIEDAACLQDVLSLEEGSVEQRFNRYAHARWQRNARVQARSIRNGEIFHATGIQQWGRDLSMRLLGEKLLDVPWLYRGPLA